jgi:glucose-6-phosphate 1-epimerase
MDLQTLTDHFAIPGVLAFEQNEHGLIRANITTPACTAELYLQGAHLTQWQPAGQEPVLFLSERSAYEPGKPIRGGVPIVFPWFGPRTPTTESPRTDGPMHGFARISVWELAFAAVAGDDLHLTLTLGPNETSRALGFDGFQLAYQLVLGAELRLQLSVANQSDAPLHFEEALHTYLAVGDAQQITLIGLSDAEYIDKTDRFAHKHQKESPLILTGETDRPYLGTLMDIDVDDPILHRRISIGKSNSRTTVLWNPWSERCAKLADMEPTGWLTMVCVETANALTDAITLPPGGHHTMEARIHAQHFVELPVELKPETAKNFSPAPNTGAHQISNPTPDAPKPDSK